MNKYDHSKKVRFLPGEIRALLLPYSEVCVHMKVSDKIMYGELKETPYKSDYPDGPTHLYSVQLYQRPAEDGFNLPYTREDLTPFSSPITYGEAGVYRDEEGFYYYPPEKNTLRYGLIR